VCKNLGFLRNILLSSELSTPFAATDLEDRRGRMERGRTLWESLNLNYVNACLYLTLELQISLDALVFSFDLSEVRNGVYFTLDDIFKDSQQNGYMLDGWD